MSKSCQKWQNSDFQSQFSMSKIIQIFLNFFSLKNMILGAHFLLLTFFENFNFYSTLFTKNMLIFRSLDLERMLIRQFIFLWKSAFYHSIKLPFDAEVAEKILNAIYCKSRKVWFIFISMHICNRVISLEQLITFFVKQFLTKYQLHWKIPTEVDHVSM